MGKGFLPVYHREMYKKKESEVLFANFTQDFMFLYILCITRKSLPSIPLFRSFCQRSILQTESNALQKSMKEQNIFIFLALSISIKECYAKTWSIVEWPDLKPAWFSFKISYSPINLLNLRLIIEVNNLLKQLTNVIGL